MRDGCKYSLKFIVMQIPPCSGRIPLTGADKPNNMPIRWEKRDNPNTK